MVLKTPTLCQLRDNVGAEVYDQIFTIVRPELMRQIKDRRAVLEGIKFSPGKRGTGSRGQGKGSVIVLSQVKRARRDPITPMKKPEPALLATQCFAPIREPDSCKSWACECDAHLRRHSRCVFAGQVQPPLHCGAATK